MKISEREFKIAIEEMREGLQIVGRDWRYLYVNEAVCRQGRSTKDRLIGRTMMECYPGIENTPAFDAFRDAMENGRVHQIENEFVYPDGKKCWFELRVEPSMHGILIRSFDISEAKKLQEQLFHAQKMDAVGRLAGGIAHDFNNKLGVMIAYCDLGLERLVEREPQIAGYLRKIRTAVVQSAAMTKQLLAFSRKQVLDPRTISMNALLGEMSPALTKLAGGAIDVKVRLAPDLGNIRVDPAQFEQVILNLCLNARDAMPEGGALTLETANVDLEAADVAARPGVAAGRYVMLAVSDTGHGMDRATREKIFEPFFTTKERGRGTGLGLATVHGIVQQSNGHIWVYSEPGLGSVFKIHFPREAGGDDARPPPKRSLGEGRGHETILLVEDDQALREAYRTALESAGYRVRPAADAGGAERIFAEAGDIDLLLTDVVLPKVGGRALAAKLAGSKPGLKVIYMSGYAEGSIASEGVLDAEAVLLQKPVALRALLESVRAVLDGILKKGLV